MAIGLLDLAIRGSQVEKKIEQVDNILSGAVNQVSGDNAKTSLESQIKQLENAELKFLTTLGLKGTIEARNTLRKNMKAIGKSSGLENLTGESIEHIISAYTDMIDEKRSLIIRAFKQLFSTKEFQKILNSHQDSTYMWKDSVLDYVNSQIISKSYGESFKGGKPIKISRQKKLNKVKSIDDIFVNAFERGVRERLMELSIQKGLLNVTTSSDGIVVTAGPNLNSTNDLPSRVKSLGDWYSITKGLKGSEAVTIDEDGNFIATANKRIKALIKDLIQSNATIPVMRLDDILNYVFKQQPTAAFVGANPQAITGLLGEIQALCYISMLTDGQFKLNQNLKWVAQSLQDGEQLHSDIVFEKMGFQVKNTVSSGFTNIDFRKIDVDEFIKQMGLDYSVANGVTAAYQMKAFNVPYHLEYDKEKGIYTPIQGNNKGYDQTYLHIQGLVTMAERLFSYLASELMYMNVDSQTWEKGKNNEGNIVYMIGGNNIFFASEILTQIMNELDKYGPLKDRSMNFKALGFDKVDTIIEVLKKETITYNDENVFDNPDKYLPQNSAYAAAQDRLLKLYLQSSFNFGNLSKSLTNIGNNI